MKKSKIVLIISLFIISFTSFSQTQTTSKATYGTEKSDLYDYFELFFKEEINVTSFKRSIFRVGIDEEGNVFKVEAVKHALEPEMATKIIEKIYDMKWNSKLNPGPVSSVLHLVFTVNKEAQLTIEIY